MESDDFICLDASQDDYNGGRDDEFQERGSRAEESECTPFVSQLTEEALTAENNQVSLGCHDGDDPNVLDMDLEDDNVRPGTVFQESGEFVSTMTMAQTANELQSNHENKANAAVTLCNGISESPIVNESPRAKRAQITNDNKQPSVRVIYNSLTRESKRKLMELMQQWTAWQAKYRSSSNDGKDEILEDGEETYFPALQTSADTSRTMSFWIDNQARKGDFKDYVQLESDMVPLYDRAYTLVGTSTDGMADSEGLRALEASRCFNCGSYNHSLKECPMPRDIVAINNARKMHGSKRNPAANYHGQTRYYQKAAGKFDDLKAGVLGPETRECLGIGEHDPPPWLHRMREMGYPPGYLDAVEDKDQPFEITIFADEENTEDLEEGELPERAETGPPQKKMTVEFPGINAPIPDNADHRRWGTPTAYSGSSSFRKQRGSFHDERRYAESRDDILPSSEHGLSSFPGRSSRYSPYDHNRTERASGFGRSLSDREHRSPVNHENSAAHGTHNDRFYSSGQRTHENLNSGWSSWQSKESHENRHRQHHR